MNYTSIVQTRGAVTFPTYAAERVYMREFRVHSPLPADLARWQVTVDDMLDGIDVDGPAYLMIDESYVAAGSTQRRPGLHIDGYWNPGVYAHGGAPGHGSYPPSHTPRPRRHAPIPSRHGAGLSSDENWETAKFDLPEAILLASTISASHALIGEYAGPIGTGGDCSHLDLSYMASVDMLSAQCYAGNVTCLHESLPVSASCFRTLVRINLPGWTPPTPSQ